MVRNVRNYVTGELFKSTIKMFQTVSLEKQKSARQHPSKNASLDGNENRTRSGKTYHGDPGRTADYPIPEILQRFARRGKYVQ